MLDLLPDDLVQSVFDHSDLSCRTVVAAARTCKTLQRSVKATLLLPTNAKYTRHASLIIPADLGGGGAALVEKNSVIRLTGKDRHRILLTKHSYTVAASLKGFVICGGGSAVLSSNKSIKPKKANAAGAVDTSKAIEIGASSASRSKHVEPAEANVDPTSNSKPAEAVVVGRQLRSAGKLKLLDWQSMSDGGAAMTVLKPPAPLPARSPPAPSVMPIKFIGKNHIRGIIFGSKLEIASGCVVTLIGCHILHGVSIGARASLQMIGCRLECLDAANVRVGKAATLVVDDSQFHGGTETVLGPARIIDCARCSKLVCTNCSFDGRANAAIYVRMGENPSDYGPSYGTGEDTSMHVLRVDSCRFDCTVVTILYRNSFALFVKGHELPSSVYIENNVRSSAMHRFFTMSRFLCCLLHFCSSYSGHFRHANLR
jgi:hypothetical protein